MDAITTLEQDHRTVEGLFDRFEKATSDEEREEIAKEVIRELSVHSCIEEQVLYPFVREAVPTLESEILEDLEEHHAVETMLAELERMPRDHERYQAKFTVIKENVKHHVQEEEENLFPKLKDAVDSETLNELGQALSAARDNAPTHPHPHSPDEPPANLLSDRVAGVMDRLRDKVRSAVS